MTILVVDAACRPLTTTWANADGTTTRVEGGEARIEAPSYEVEIREVATGDAVRVIYERPWDEDEESRWVDGNWSCDCNRQLAFRRGKGWTEEQVWADDTGFCQGDGKYKVTVRINGVVVLDDAETTAGI